MIIRSACQDTEYTACSLSAVSRYIRELSKPFKYKSIALLSPKQISGFANIVAQRPSDVLGLRHLFITDVRSLDGFFEAALGNALKVILPAVAPTIQSLTILCAQNVVSVLTDYSQLYFPVLRELNLFAKAIHTFRLLPIFPALERLHLWNGPDWGDWSSFSEMRNMTRKIRYIFPSLKYLRLSEYDNTCWFPFLLGIRPYVDSINDRTLPSTVIRLFIQPRSDRAEFDGPADVFTREDERVVLLRPRDANEGLGLNELVKIWIEGNEGLEGWWPGLDDGE